ncbi:MAG: hypothetical protein AB4060_05505 [Crocosphaera sp.]|uniref:hypothetical protein n=1 Tax=Crocosphaera sp. TaxID=2729996 RepID=UPI002586E63E|nr:hypothetical protein [Crocosphaera sp.]MCH2247934.1 hypothetical protein [Crocosphaera sp.]
MNEEQEKKREHISLTHKPLHNHPDYHLIVLLKRRKKEQGIIPKESMLEATKAFWLPIACLNVDTYSPEILEQIFWESLAKLNAQQELLWNIVGKALRLERPQMMVGSEAMVSHNQKEDLLFDQSDDSDEVIHSGLDYDEAGIL